MCDFSCCVSNYFAAKKRGFCLCVVEMSPALDADCGTGQWSEPVRMRGVNGLISEPRRKEAPNKWTPPVVSNRPPRPKDSAPEKAPRLLVFSLSSFRCACVCCLNRVGGIPASTDIRI